MLVLLVKKGFRKNTMKKSLLKKFIFINHSKWMYLYNFFGLDKTVLLTLLNRLWPLLSGFGSIFLISRHFTPELQGYYYTFGSLIALQVFVELGLTYAIVQFISHEMTGLYWSENQTIQGKKKSKRRLQSIMNFSFLWFSVAALILVAFLIPAGILFFKINSPEASTINLNVAWALVVIITAIILIENSALAILEGCNKIAEVSIIRLTQSLLSTLALWFSLINDFGLYSLVVSIFVSALVALLFLIFCHGGFFKDLYKFQIKDDGIDWLTEIWPFQWRIAVSWISGYSINQSLTPILFAVKGANQAAQIGMSLQIIFALNSAALVWITIKSPLFGRLIAEKENQLLDKTFFSALVKSYWFMFCACSILIIVLFVVKAKYPLYYSRVIPAKYFLILLVASIINHFINSAAYYLRAYKEEKLMYPSIFMSLFITGSAFILIPLYGGLGAVLAYFFGIVLVGFPWTFLILIKKIRKGRVYEKIINFT